MITHWLLGQRALERADKELPGLDFDRESFLFGCQGPDILFFHRIQPLQLGENFRRYGYRMHDGAPSPVFDSLRRTLAECPAERRRYVLGYSLGMCCHYSYDSTVHPYVNWLAAEMAATDRRGADYGYHSLIETMLDVILLRRSTGLEPRGISAKFCLSRDAAVREAVAMIYRRMLADVYGVELPERASMQLTPDMRSVFGALSDHTYLKLPLARLLEHVVGKQHGLLVSHLMPRREDDARDYLNTGHTTWHNTKAPEQTGTENFLELTDLSLERTMAMMSFFIKAMTSGESFAEYTGERTFSYGVPPCENGHA